MIFIKLIFGFIAGLTASLGLGGGYFLLIYLILFGHMQQLQAQACNLFFFILIAIISVILSAKNGLINFKVLGFCVLFGVFGVGLGLLIGFFVPVYFIQKIFAIFLMIVGFRELFFNKS